MCNYINCITFVENQLKTMSKLFEYSNIVQKEDFIGRNEEVNRLSNDFMNLQNSAVLAPQGWGKSSLLHKSAQVASRKDGNLCVCMVDLSNVRNEERFYELLAQAVLRSVSRNQKEVVENVNRLFNGIKPRISLADAFSFSVDFDWNDLRLHQDEVLDLPMTVAREKGLKIVVCIDEFHAISQFDRPELLLEKFSSHWPAHENVAYCVSGSSVSTVEKFLKSSSVFKDASDVIHLGQIDRTEMVRSFRDKFADTGKYLDEDNAGLIIDLAGSIPLYVQQVAHLSWMGTSVVCSREVVEQAHQTIVDQMGSVFENLTSSFTEQQLCYLRAVIAGETVISTSEVLHRYRITSATSASRSKSALIDRRIISSSNGKTIINDPIYSYWLKHRYFY